MSRIAVIGAGIAGMSAAYLLSRRHEVWLFEREARLGGHTHTHAIQTSRGVQAIDSGFIVHNDLTYPNLVRLFNVLGVERQKSDMSFGVSDAATGLEYSSRGMSGFFASWRNLVRPAHYRLFAEILRFNRESIRRIREGLAPETTLGEYLRELDFHPDFFRHYLYPMASAVWSTPLDRIADFPAATLLRFFLNHGFLTVNGHPQWYVVKGGSSTYIQPLTEPYRDRIVTRSEIRSVYSDQGSAVIRFEDGREQHFHEVVFACHAPQALHLLGDASEVEQAVLGSFATQPNTATLHTDAAVLPKRAAARASWNYHLGRCTSAPALTYSMNRLQSLDTREDYCVTLNGADTINRSTILREMVYHHPLYTAAAVKAQQHWQEVSGIRRRHFCGAYWFDGFHEDRFNSAIRVAKSLGVDW